MPEKTLTQSNPAISVVDVWWLIQNSSFRFGAGASTDEGIGAMLYTDDNSAQVLLHSPEIYTRTSAMKKRSVCW
jgi:hypothetical protein